MKGLRCPQCGGQGFELTALATATVKNGKWPNLWDMGPRSNVVALCTRCGAEEHVASLLSESTILADPA